MRGVFLFPFLSLSSKLYNHFTHTRACVCNFCRERDRTKHLDIHWESQILTNLHSWFFNKK